MKAFDKALNEQYKDYLPSWDVGHAKDRIRRIKKCSHCSVSWFNCAAHPVTYPYRAGRKRFPPKCNLKENKNFGTPKRPMREYIIKGGCYKCNVHFRGDPSAKCYSCEILKDTPHED